MNFEKFFRHVTYCVFLCAGVSSAQTISGAIPRYLASPSLDKTHIVEVEYIENSKFLKSNQSEINRILEIAAAIAWQHFSARVEFKLSSENKQIEEVLKSITSEEQAAISRGLYDFKNKNGDKNLMILRTANALRISGDDTPQARSFAMDYLTTPPKSSSLIDFSEALVETQLTRLNQWNNLRNDKGINLLDDSLANEYLMWNTYVIKKASKHLILTNQLIASAEYVGNSIHSAIRGGVSNGFTSPASNSSSGMSSVVSFFPFVSQDSTTMSIRDGVFTNTDAQEFAIAAMIVHELGHQLLHLGHPFEDTACIMTPPKLLHFQRWLSNINAKLCPVGSNPAMTPGAIKFIDMRRALQK